MKKKNLIITGLLASTILGTEGQATMVDYMPLPIGSQFVENRPMAAPRLAIFSQHDLNRALALSIKTAQEEGDRRFAVRLQNKYNLKSAIAASLKTYQEQQDFEMAKKLQSEEVANFLIKGLPLVLINAQPVAKTLAERLVAQKLTLNRNQTDDRSGPRLDLADDVKSAKVLTLAERLVAQILTLNRNQTDDRSAPRLDLADDVEEVAIPQIVKAEVFIPQAPPMMMDEAPSAKKKFVLVARSADKGNVDNVFRVAHHGKTSDLFSELKKGRKLKKAKGSIAQTDFQIACERDLIAAQENADKMLKLEEQRQARVLAEQLERERQAAIQAEKDQNVAPKGVVAESRSSLLSGIAGFNKKNLRSAVLSKILAKAPVAEPSAFDKITKRRSLMNEDSDSDVEENDGFWD